VIYDDLVILFKSLLICYYWLG